MKNTVSNKITRHLMENNSYFKWSTTRLAEKYNCSVKTMTSILDKLEKIKRTYLKRLSK